jgi:predicted nucleotidyltransferase
MTFQETKELSAKTIREEFAASGISVGQIVLLGSRSREDARPDSDWDFLVSVKEELSFSEKAIISTKIQTKLAEKLISADVIIRSEAKLNARARKCWNYNLLCIKRRDFGMNEEIVGLLFKPESQKAVGIAEDVRNFVLTKIKL